uniref:Uncharacterized protein n=1 Tax=Paramormyrops kingsleyae TaxID=1676925 RepID=A0A3B3RHC2_9TELE
MVASQDLGTEFGSQYPRHGLSLLYWFCHEYISFDNNNEMKPNRDPQDGAYGFHYYGNNEDLLDSLSDHQGYAYYTVGNLLANVNSPDNERLPDYVFRYFRTSRYLYVWDQNNRDRIIVRRTPWGNIDRVYITQHYTRGTCSSTYDPDNTFRISRELIEDIHSTPRNWYFQYFGIYRYN